MTNPFVRKLEHGAELSDADRAALVAACTTAFPVPARHDLIREGQAPSDVHLILDGFACRYKHRPDGQRSILAYLVPGDLCDLHVAILGKMDHSVATLSACTIVAIDRDTILDLTEKHPMINRALWWSVLTDEGTLREWLVNVGRRSAHEQVAHLLCELLVRLQAVGFATEKNCTLPITQIDLADTVGLSAVHTNRVIQDLRADGLIILKDMSLTIPDFKRLTEFAEFNPSYLHFNLICRRWVDRKLDRPCRGLGDALHIQRDERNATFANLQHGYVDRHIAAYLHLDVTGGLSFFQSDRWATQKAKA